MCGYCIEEIGIETILVDKNLPDDKMLNSFYLQEIMDLLSGIEILIDNMDGEISKEEQLDFFNPQVILCRLIEKIVINRIDSSSYGSMLQNEIIQKSL